MLDVCLLLEGTYPFVAGGVSTWVSQLIGAMRDLNFGIVFITSHSDPTRQYKYEIPENVTYFKEVYLQGHNGERPPARRAHRDDFQTVEKFYSGLEEDRFEEFFPFISLFQGENSCLNAPLVFSSEKIWKLLAGFYEKTAPHISFLDYFWNWRATHLPLLQILQCEVPPAKVYHSVSTGYAGLLGAIAKVTRHGSLILTEHGIYTLERLLEISQANWIYEETQRRFKVEQDLSFFKQWWVNLFKSFGKITYHYSDEIYTLFEGNRSYQILDGANPRRVKVIPNGINIRQFQNLPRVRKAEPHIGFVGRVVSIKDVKTFILAAKLCLYQIPEARFLVLGPYEEEPEYFKECRNLVESLDLQERLTFTGRVNIMEYYSFLDLVVLTSLSEAQPFVILEANVCGIPVVATNVGACKEMLEGQHAEDAQLGPSGIITDVVNPEQTAQAMIRLLQDKMLYQSCAEAGRRRVERYYDEEDLLSKYLNIYERYL
ncbi:MAG TPA: group 1 glycosyl transferase [Deltaproteobacteria bacterium]|nr:group 1 glycosyl transferase [Deltaproteobacteria bacterium]